LLFLFAESFIHLGGNQANETYRKSQEQRAMGRKKLQWSALFIVLGVIAFVPLRAAAAANVVSWNNSTTYSDGTSIPLSLQASIESKLYYSYDGREWTWFASVPNGGTSWAGVLPLAEIVQGFYAITSTIPVQGTESPLSDSIQYPPPVAGEAGTFTVSLGSCTDTYVNHGWHSLDTYAAEPVIGTYTLPASNAANRGFLQWDLSALPPDVTIANATLGLYYVTEEGGGGDNSYQVSVAKVTGVAPVLDLANWNTYDGVTPWSAGGDGGAANLDAAKSSALVGKTHGWVTWDVTKMVQEWVAAPETNHGMAVDPDGAASAGSNRFFASREHPDLYPRPQLVVTYQYPPAGTAVIKKVTDALDANHAANRGFLRWDLSSLPPDITVTSATLGLYQVAEEDGVGEPPCEVTVARVTGVHHAHHGRHRHRHDGATAWPEIRDGGAANLAAPESSTLLPMANGWVAWDVTQMVQGWVGAPETNNGMVIEAHGAGAADSKRYFISRESPDPDLRPQLVITYQSNRR
jgi:hypothetical protein